MNVKAIGCRIDKTGDESWGLACETLSKQGLLDERCFAFRLDVPNKDSRGAVAEQLNTLLKNQCLVCDDEILDDTAVMVYADDGEGAITMILPYCRRDGKETRRFKFRLSGDVSACCKG